MSMRDWEADSSLLDAEMLLNVSEQLHFAQA